MNNKPMVLFLIILTGLSGLVGLCGCNQNGANDGVVGEGSRNSSGAGPSAPSASFQVDDVNRILALDGKSVEDVIEALGDIKASYTELDSKGLASQLDQIVSIRCDGDRCEIARKGGV